MVKELDVKEAVSAAEAVLFACGEPVDLQKLAQTLEQDVPTMKKILSLLSDRLEERGSGLELVYLDESVQICTKAEYAPHIRKLLDLRRNTPLSQAAMEVLAVVAYNQPVTKAFVEQVRGVDSSGVISSLVGKGLIEEKGRLELPGRPLLYGTTPDFLRCMQIENLSHLKPIPGRELKEEPEEMPEEELGSFET